MTTNNKEGKNLSKAISSVYLLLATTLAIETIIRWHRNHILTVPLKDTIDHWRFCLKLVCELCTVLTQSMLQDPLEICQE